MKSILADICECVPETEYVRLHDRLVFVDWGNETHVGDHTMDFNGHLLSMTRVTTDDFASVYEGLLQAERLYSPKVIRELKGSIFRLAERMDPESELITTGFDALLDRLEPGQKVAVQIAVSPSAIGNPISPEDIYQDVVLDDLGVDNRFVVDAYLETHVQRLAGGIPFYKYVAGLGNDVGKAIERYRGKLNELDKFRTKSIRRGMESKHRTFAGHTSVAGLTEACAPRYPFAFIPYLYDWEIDADELGDLLKRTLLSTGEGTPERRSLLKDSNFRKCIRIYDFLRYAEK